MNPVNTVSPSNQASCPVPIVTLIGWFCCFSFQIYETSLNTASLRPPLKHYEAIPDTASLRLSLTQHLSMFTGFGTSVK